MLARPGIAGCRRWRPATEDSMDEAAESRRGRRISCGYGIEAVGRGDGAGRAMLLMRIFGRSATALYHRTSKVEALTRRPCFCSFRRQLPSSARLAGGQGQQSLGLQERFGCFHIEDLTSHSSFIHLDLLHLHITHPRLSSPRHRAFVPSAIILAAGPTASSLVETADNEITVRPSYIILLGF